MQRAARRLRLLVAAVVVIGCSPTPAPTPTAGPPVAPTAADSAAPIPTDATAALPSDGPVAPGLLLTEVGFGRVSGGSPFVEISNVGPSSAAVAGATLHLDAGDLPLSAAAPPLAPGAQLLIVFDGLGTTDATIVHGPAGLSLAAGAGAVTLLDQGGRPVDGVAWGAGQPDGVKLSAGDIAVTVVPTGSTIGRPPGANRPNQPLDWVLYTPAEATPGHANAMATVGVLLPPSGAVIDGTQATLGWYPVAAATGYRVQIASDEHFASVLVDQTVSGPQVDTGTLPPGEYAWHVAALAADGGTPTFSDASHFGLEVATGPAPAALDETGRKLAVPLLSQHKDTAMLLLEDPVETGPRAWDNDHVTFSPADPADSQNCAFASIAMINHFFGGDLSQDRIGYEIFAELIRPKAPERDLNWGYGVYPDLVTKALTFALGAAPIHLNPGMSADEVWTTIKGSIDAGRPVLVAGRTHVFVFTGYSVRGGKRLFSTNDAWHYAGGPAGTGLFDIDAATDKNVASGLDVWLMPATAVGRHQEASVTTDSDGDGVVDFDETVRFHTNPADQDTDADGVHDKQDIVSGVFDPTYGYAREPKYSAGRDIDVDNIPTELDPDSDAGGCKDGAEDKNGDGHRNGKETWNFDVSDDACHDLFGTITFDRTSSYDSGVGSVSRQTNQETLHATVEVRMQINPDDPTELIDAGSTFTVDRKFSSDREVGSDCSPSRYTSTSNGTYRFNGPAVPSPGHTADELGPGDPGSDVRITGLVDRDRALMSISMIPWYPETTSLTCVLPGFENPFGAIPDVIDDWACGTEFSGLALGVDARIGDQSTSPIPVTIDCSSEGRALGWDKKTITVKGQLSLISH